MDLYEWVRGPLASVAFGLFILGICYRLFILFRIGTNPEPLYPKETIPNGVKSVILGVTPFGTNHMRRRPLFTIVTALFHICVMVLPLFFTAHIVLWFESCGVHWTGIPNGLADVMTLFVLFSAVLFFVRRCVTPEVRQVSQATDYLVPVMIFLIFLSGFLAFHQLGPYRPLLISHILLSEILLVMIPFSRLAHMILYPFSRYEMGSDFGRVLKLSDW